MNDQTCMTWTNSKFNNNLNIFFCPNLFVPGEDIIGFSELKEGTLLQDFPCIYW